MSAGIAKLQQSYELHDPRTRLVREKYFSVRPKPLERWLWSKNVPASAERVFWLHWQEGRQRGDWCSEIPLRRVAHECHLDVSTVTRAYQCLVRLGCIRRTDPGRNPANPFQQATAVTEVRIPTELLQALNRYPNRRPPTEQNQAGRADNPTHSAADQPEHTTALAHPSYATPKPESANSSAIAHPHEPVESPLTALKGRDRAKAIAEITAHLSPTERDTYHHALRLHLPTMSFDLDSKVSPENQNSLIGTLALLAAADTATPRIPASPTATPTPKASHRPLSLFHIARLKRDIQTATSTSAAPEILRQVVWSIEAGALRRFSPLHALNIALKKVREGSWTRPHRMAPNWTPSFTTAASGTTSPPETCSAA